MLSDHDKFIEEVINKVAKQKTFKTTKKERKDKEEATIESLMEVTGLKRLEVKKIMEKTRKEQRKNEANHSDTALILKVLLGCVCLVVLVATIAWL